MNMPHPSMLPLLVMLPLIAWRMYSRVRRMVGRQPSSAVRPWITLAIFPTLVVMLALGALGDSERLAALAVGLVLGGALGVWGLRLTRFEATPQGLFYTPNLHLGIALSLLFVGRLLYRLVEVFMLNDSAPVGPMASMGGADFVRSRLTLAIFGLLAGYYTAYAIGLLRWRAVSIREAPKAV